MRKENVHKERRRSCEPSELSAASCPLSPPAAANSATRAHDTLQKEGTTPVEQVACISNEWQPRPILMIGTQIFRFDTCNVVDAAYNTK